MYKNIFRSIRKATCKSLVVACSLSMVLSALPTSALAEAIDDTDAAIVDVTSDVYPEDQQEGIVEDGSAPDAGVAIVDTTSDEYPSDEQEGIVEESPAPSEVSDVIEFVEETDAVEAESSVASDASAELEVVSDTEEVVETVSVEDSGPDSEALLDAYVEQLFEAELPSSKRERRLSAQASAGSQLTGNNKKVYEYLKQLIKEVALGTRTSTVFEVPVSVLELGKSEYTAEDLGLETLGETGEPSDEAKAKIAELVSLDLKAINRALLVDCPYELYWYRKTGIEEVDPALTMSGFTCGYSRTGNTVLKIILNDDYSSATFSFKVSSDYADGVYSVVTSHIDTVNAAIANAKSIVQANAGKSGYSKLKAYKEAICAMTDYNSTAAADSATNPLLYGDPWQLVWVFDGIVDENGYGIVDANQDGKDDTPVVCEGYSKAFKYLCDLTTSGLTGIECYIANGEMDGGPHMWNIVTMPNGQNYMVDVTNCDSGTAGYPDLLFMKAPESGSAANGYVFAAKNKSGRITYTYDDALGSVIGDNVLTLASDDWVDNPVQTVNNVVVSLSTTSYTYDGTSQIPTVTGVTADGVALNDSDYDVTYPSEAIDAGTYTVTLKGNYEGSGSAQFEIAPMAVTPTVTLSQQSFTYNGTVQTPSITKVSIGQTELDEADYTVSYSEGRVNKGTYTVTVTLNEGGNYTGEGRASYEIVQASISGATIALLNSQTRWTYTGNAIEPVVVSVKLNGRTLSPDTDYAVPTYSNNTEIGNATVTVTGEGNYIGTATTTFAIVEVPTQTTQLLGSNVTVYEQEYTGESQEPDVLVKVGEETLVKGEDYIVSGSGCDAGDYTATITGINEYSGQVSKSYRIRPQNVTPQVSLQKNSFRYDGQEHKPVPTVKVGETTLDENSYDVNWSGSCVNAGSYTLTVTLKGNYEGSNTADITIIPKTVTPDVSLSKTSFTYTGAVQKPEVTAVTAEGVAQDPSNWEASFPSSKDANSYEVSVALTGGNYRGTGKAKYTIAPKTVTPVVSLSKTSYTYSGSAQKPTVTSVTADGEVLNSQNWTASIPNGVDAGSYSVTVSVTGGNYRGTGVATFKVNAKSISDSTVAVSGPKAQTYTGKALVPAVTVKDTATGATLKKGTSYTLSYKNKATGKAVAAADLKAAGTYTVTIAGKGNYRGTGTATFKINAKSIAASTVAVSGLKAQTYTGKALVPAVTVKDTATGATLKKGTSYTLSYKNAATGKAVAAADLKAAGTYIVTIAGKGNYAGSRSVSFVVNKAANPMKVTVTAKTAKYATVKTKAVTVAPITLATAAKGTVTYKKTSGSARLTVAAKTGKVTVKKGTKKGTYTAKIKVSAAGNANYKPLAKTVTVQVVVK